MDKDKLYNLRKLSVNYLKYCENCFAKWHCAGDCAAHSNNSSGNESQGSKRCEANRKLISHRIARILETKNNYQKEETIS